MYPFKDGDFAVENGWYVAAFSQDVTHSLQAKWILNRPVALYRTEAGEPIALHGLCPHRHFPLGESQLHGDEVVCAYHGFRFNSSGQCTGIPGQDHIPSSSHIRSYTVVDHGMWLWIWMGDQPADPSLLPDLETIGYCGNGMESRPFYRYEVEGRYQLLNDNLMDLSHLGYLHGSSIGTAIYADTPEELSEGPGYIRSERKIVDTPPPPARAHIADRIDRVSGMVFYFPGFHAGFDDSFLPQSHLRAGETLERRRVFHAVTPSTLDTTYYFFGMSSLNGDGLDEAYEYLQPVVDEDVFATREIEKALSRCGESLREVTKKSDANSVRGRRILQKMMDDEKR